MITVTWPHTPGTLALLAAAIGWGASCGRTEEPGSPPRREPSRPAASAAAIAPSPPAQGSRCLVPMSDTPRPTARPATRCPPDPSGDYDLPRGSVTFVDAPGGPRVAVELARTEAHRARGLMFRQRMATDAGMLFSWQDEQIRSFWMRNTCIPLDMLFIARDGTIVGILEQVPTLNEDPRSIPCPAAHVLELNAGWCRTHGVRAGQKVVIEHGA
jgi:uncharacterized protein